VPRNCKTCMSPHRSYIEQQLQNHAPARVIVAELAQRGESITEQNISTHRNNHWARDDPMSESVAQVVRELEQEAAMAPPVVASAYLVLIQALQQLKHAKPTADTVIKASEAVTRITGMRTQQHLLMAYMEKAFAPQEVESPSTTVKQLPPPE
jgi:hypothetical protein